MKKKPLSAAELLAKLNSDAEFVATREKEETERQARAAEWRRAETPLVEDLRSAGLSVGSAWDLVNTQDQYTHALHILVDHLQRPYPSRVREGIARALALPQSIAVWGVLVRSYCDEDEKDAKEGLAVAISVAADDTVIEEVVELVRNRRHGSSRVLLLSALERSTDPRAVVALTDLRTDPDLSKEIKNILRRLEQCER